MGKTKPLISVIIPVYNRQDYISDCITSVLDQTGAGEKFDLEVIVVDDGSTDATTERLKKFGKSIKSIRTRNSGRPAVPRNIGLSHANGEFIAFQDSDDIWEKSKLVRELSEMKPGIGVICSNAGFITETGKSTGKRIIPTKERHHGHVLRELIENNFVCTLSVLVRTELLKQVGKFNESPKLRAVEDYELWLRLAAVTKFHYIPEPLVEYRRHAQNISEAGEYESLVLIVRALRSAERDTELTIEQKIWYCHRIITQQFRLSQIAPQSTRIAWKIATQVSRLRKVRLNLQLNQQKSK